MPFGAASFSIPAQVPEALHLPARSRATKRWTAMDRESWPSWTRRLFSIDVDRWWKLREGIPLEVAVHLTIHRHPRHG